MIQSRDIQTLRKRDGSRQTYTSSKVVRHLKELASITPPLSQIDVENISNRVQDTLSANMSTSDLSDYVSEVCAALTVTHWQYGSLGGRVAISKLHRGTPNSFVECVMALQHVLNSNFVECCQRHADTFNDMIVHERDFQYDIMGVRTLQRSYLLKSQGIIVERPQYMLMRVAVALHGDDIESVRETYEATSKLLYTHATPTLFHAGLQQQQMASCFLMTMTEDSIEGIFETLKRCAKISKGAGGIGLSVSNIRGTGSPIMGTNGVSNGLSPMLRVFNDTARYVDQGAVNERDLLPCSSNHITLISLTF